MTFRQFLMQQSRRRSASSAGARILLATYPRANSAESFRHAITEKAAGDASEEAGRHWATLEQYEEAYTRPVYSIVPTKDDWEELPGGGHKRKEHKGI